VGGAKQWQKRVPLSLIEKFRAFLFFNLFLSYISLPRSWQFPREREERAPFKCSAAQRRVVAVWRTETETETDCVK
jgi:hypothetical protein